MLEKNRNCASAFVFASFELRNAIGKTTCQHRPKFLYTDEDGKTQHEVNYQTAISMLHILSWIHKTKENIRNKESWRDFESWRQLHAKLGSHTILCAILDHLAETPKPNFSHRKILFGIVR